MGQEAEWRYFELGAPPDGKFWCVRPIPGGYEVWFASHGKGSKPRKRRGQVSASVFESDADATANLAARVEEKRAKGYVEGPPVPPEEGPPARKFELARTLARKELDPRFRGGRRLYGAILDGSTKRVVKILNEGISPNVSWFERDEDDGFREWRVFQTALHFGDGAMVEAFLEAGASLDQSELGVEPLGWAIQWNEHWSEVAEVLLRAGADPNAVGDEGARPLHAAIGIFHGAVRIAPAIRMLADAGADLGGRDTAGRTPLHAACSTAMGVVTAAEALLELGADPNARDAEGKTPLDLCRGRYRVDLHGCQTIATLLEAHGASADIGDDPLLEVQRLLNGLRSPRRRMKDLSGAAWTGDVELVKRYLADGQHPDEPWREGFYPIQRAGARGHWDVVDALLAAGARPRGFTRIDERKSKDAAKSIDGIFAQMIPGFGNEFSREDDTSEREAACEEADARIALLLANPETLQAALTATSDRDPLLSVAAELGLASTVRALLAGGAAVDGLESSEWTPLLLAARENQPEIVEQLLAAGANVAGGTDDRVSPLSAAAHSGSLRAVEALLGAGADPLWLGVMNQTAINQAEGPDRNAIRRRVREAIGDRLEEKRVLAVRAKSRKKGRFTPSEMSGLGPDLNAGLTESVLLAVPFERAVAALEEILPVVNHVADVAKKVVAATEHFAVLFNLRDRPECWLSYVYATPEDVVREHVAALSKTLDIEIVHVTWSHQKDVAAQIFPGDRRLATSDEVHEFLQSAGAWLPPHQIIGEGRRYDPGFHALLAVRGVHKKDVVRADVFGFEFR